MMTKLQLLISLVILINYLNLPATTSLDVRDLGYCTSDIKWHLVHRYEFTDDIDMDDEWEIMHEFDRCRGNGIEQISCNNYDNVKVDSGYLTLSARREQFNNFNFTGATLTSKTNFTRGRWEMKIRFSMDDYLRMAITTKHPLNKKIHRPEHGGIELAIFKSFNKNMLLRNVLFQDVLDSESLHVDPFVNQTDFHIIGIEWSPEQLKFFIDDQYSEPVLFDKSQNRTLESNYYLQMQLGVGGPTIDLPEKSVLLNDLEWDCPAVIIDYIRIFEPYRKGGCLDFATEEKSKMKEETITKGICAKYATRKTILNVYASYKTLINSMLFALGVALTLCLIACLIYKNRALKNSLIEKTNDSNINDNLRYLNTENKYGDDENPYEVYDEQHGLDSPEYTEIHRESRDYLTLENADIDEKYIELVDCDNPEYTCMKETKV